MERSATEFGPGAAEVVGIDSAPDMVRSAQSRGIEAHVCAAQDFAAEGTFEFAISNAVFPWILAPRPALRAVYRALRPGGKFVGELVARATSPL